MKLEENCRKSMCNCTRRINIRYFFVIDRLTAGDIYIKYYPTEKMVVDFYTKLFYGKLFRMFRNLILKVGFSATFDFLELTSHGV